MIIKLKGGFTWSKSKELPKLNDISGWEQYYGPMKFALGSWSKIWKMNGANVASLACYMLVVPT